MQLLQNGTPAQDSGKRRLPPQADHRRGGEGQQRQPAQDGRAQPGPVVQAQGQQRQETDRHLAVGHVGGGGRGEPEIRPSNAMKQVVGDVVADR